MRVRKKFVYFLFAGATGALIELLFFNLFYLEFNFAVSKALALVIALSINFLLNRTFTFLARDGHLTKQAIRYIGVYSVAIVVNYSVSLITHNFIGNGLLNSNISTALGILAGIPITFFGSLYFVFRK